MTPTVRLGVTGLARSGKTVFITALVRNLVAGGRLPFFAAMAEGRITRAYLEPQPDDSMPRFAYEEHLAELAKDPPQWPESTRRISQLRVTIEYTPATALRRALGPGRLHVDIVDYPGEWLIDLPLLDLSFAEWSRRAVAEARAPQRAAAAKAWLAFLSALDADAPARRAGGAHRRSALHALSAGRPRAGLRADGAGTGPLPAAGRPCRLAPADVLSAAPESWRRLPARHPGRHAGAPLRELQDARRAAVLPRPLRPAGPADRADRRARAASTPGADALADLQHSMEAMLECFRPGANTGCPPSCPAHRPSAVRRHQGRPPAPHQPRPAGGDPARWWPRRRSRARRSPARRSR